MKKIAALGMSAVMVAGMMAGCGSSSDSSSSDSKGGSKSGDKVELTLVSGMKIREMPCRK